MFQWVVEKWKGREGGKKKGERGKGKRKEKGKEKGKENEWNGRGGKSGDVKEIVRLKMLNFLSMILPPYHILKHLSCTRLHMKRKLELHIKSDNKTRHC